MRTEQPSFVNNRLPFGYCIVATYVAGSNAARPLASGGKIVLFDTVAIAQQFIPLLGQGRTPSWSEDGETISFVELDMGGISRAVIVTDYDPYDVPVDFPGGIRSESRSREWKNHIMWSHAFYDCGQSETEFRDGMEKRADGDALPVIETRSAERVASVETVAR
ncbi:MAG: hypothetical protein H8F28_19840 [Fibrella sp.]|nr:hypothetical protein [Armatimonadota bacterium]